MVITSVVGGLDRSYEIVRNQELETVERKSQEEVSASPDLKMSMKKKIRLEEAGESEQKFKKRRRSSIKSGFVVVYEENEEVSIKVKGLGEVEEVGLTEEADPLVLRWWMII